MNKFSLLESTKSESFYHKAIKQLIYKFVSENNKKVVKSSLEKYFNNRRADVYFKLNTGQEIVVEIQNSYITIKELIKRTKDYIKKGIHVLWILYGKGQCVASPKSPEDKKNVKISPVENFLHKIYGGRVYYVDINFYDNKITITPPFVLHFSPSNKKTNQIYQKDFKYYYIKDSNHAKIPDWNFLCVEYSGFKLARFYDKNIKSTLKNLILNYFQKKTKKSCSNCRILFKKYKKCSLKKKCNFKRYKDKKLVKIIIKRFNTKYGKYFILETILDLIKEEKIRVNYPCLKARASCEHGVP